MTEGTTVITGISGFIARNLATSLLNAGGSVVGIGRTPPDGLFSPGFRFLPCDVRDADAVHEALAEVRPETVYHLAAQSVLTAGGDAGARGVLETNVAGTWNVLESARRLEIPAVVLASSDKQYGATAPPPYDDEDTTGFVNGGLYELSKAQADQAARLYAGLYDTPAVRVARLVNIYGPGDRNFSRIVPGTIRRALNGERPRLTAGPAGESLREYLFVDDATRALRALATDAHTQGNAPFRTLGGKLARVGVNIASPHRWTAAGVIETVRTTLRDAFGIDSPEPDVLPGPIGVFEPGHQYNRPERIAALLPDWSPRSLPDGLRETIPWYLTGR
ncbi:MAG: NAD(P)-dependent oxidoreductase [Capsulimonadales bacterium]|nr:NAD(P)-dependent oxidoreductase [Capsulimonadales bacterium]